MTHDEARRWAEQWVEEWNRHDVEAVLTHFADDVEFCSPVAATVTGDPSGTVRGQSRAARVLDHRAAEPR